MMMAILLLAVLFICGFINFYIPPKFFVWIQSFFPNPASFISNKPTVAPKKEKKSSHDKTELEKVFSTFDKDGDGFITKQELGESLKNMGLFTSEKEVVNMVEKLDTSGDGLIDLDEFYELYNSLGRLQDVGGSSGKDNIEDDESDLREVFYVFDGNGDGLITGDELGSVLTSLGLKQGMGIEDCKEMIRKFDMDGDGKVNFEEFKRMMKAGERFVEVS